MDGQKADLIQTAFHERIEAHNLSALWVARRGVDLTRPAAAAEAAIWRFDEVRPAIMEGGEITTAEDVFRRVLVLENPAFHGEMRVTNTLFAGLQLVLPGESAPCHRHTQTALRFVLEGTGAFTSVDGERTALHPGDFVLTPCWSWHDHVNEGDGPVIWLDILDTPLVGFLDTVFREFHDPAIFPATRPEGDAPARYGAGLMPMDHRPANGASPVFNYNYTRMREALETMRASDRWDACHGLKMQYVNPATGGPVTPTMAAFLQLLPKGFEGAGYRSTESNVCVVVEGTGRTVVDGQTLEWGPRDVFVVPGWRRYQHQADEDAVLFSVTERPVQQTLGLWREERADGSA